MAEPADTFATAINQRLAALTEDELFKHSQLGLYVYDLTDERSIYEYNIHQRMRPASCMKILTATTALVYLGGDYNYQTRLYVADSTHIYLRGGMDPLIGADDLRAFTIALNEMGVTRIDSIICDCSIKDTLCLGWGWCWDDDDVPLTPFLYQSKDNFKRKFRQALDEAGIAFSGLYVKGRVPEGARLTANRKHSIDQILHPMLKNSSNICAESLFYQIAARDGKPYASRKDASRYINQYIKKCGSSTLNLQVADGSGLSLYNYVTPALLVDALRCAYHNEEIYNHLYPALPIMGRDGTLKKRCRGRSAQDRVHAKTGTVEGVSSLAGYAMAPNGHDLAFAIINQGIREGAHGRAFQDRVCNAMTMPLDTIASEEPDSIAEMPEEE